MKALPILAALLCAACAMHDKVANDDAYQPPVYRTGSHLPNQGGTLTSPDTASVSGDAVRQSMPPPLVRKPPGG
ncbi:MAG: hypothetical protein ABI881_02915 [Betaproteobacteria bacterium]